MTPEQQQAVLKSADQRIKTRIGELEANLQFALAQIEFLEKLLADKTKTT